jgi:hypothetical protein
MHITALPTTAPRPHAPPSHHRATITAQPHTCTTALPHYRTIATAHTHQPTHQHFSTYSNINTSAAQLSCVSHSTNSKSVISFKTMIHFRSASEILSDQTRFYEFFLFRRVMVHENVESAHLLGIILNDLDEDFQVPELQNGLCLFDRGNKSFCTVRNTPKLLHLIMNDSL